MDAGRCSVVDLLPEGQGRLLQCLGGVPANVAVGIARLNGNIVLHDAAADILANPEVKRMYLGG